MRIKEKSWSGRVVGCRWAGGAAKGVAGGSGSLPSLAVAGPTPPK